jgi:phage baseplate assembly protein W
MHILYPFQISSRGRTAEATDDVWIRGLIEQVLFTSPGERVNRPTFGSGLRQLVFAPNSGMLAAAVQATVQAALQQWLGDLVLIESVQATGEDGTLTVQVQYVVRRTQQRQAATFQRAL